MKRTVNILVVEDNEDFNNLIMKALRQSIHFTDQQKSYKLVLYSYTDSSECYRKIKSQDLQDGDIIAFINYLPGELTSGNDIVNLLKNQSNNPKIVLLCQSKETDNQNKLFSHDYSVPKDKYAPALCRLYLDQFIDNKFS